ncbi:MAG: magnesium transporter [Methanobrevibacter arboriphilus]|jgi:mgtE-like transporter|uniref:magnesium transporter n=1 Tax=Methanobrevibacter arboriphilus TaxID=39441 RepID=UPI002492E01E|nr:magnesium transporter [Methanobrevibacter arboriphilus]MCC7562331.1 magnesium transporter [Methanobrevibacter arboriphilus]
MKKIKLLLKMIRQIFSIIISFIVNSFIFIYRKINYLFSIPYLIGHRFKYFFKETNDVLREAFIALLICAIGDLFAGIILGNMTSFLAAFPGLLVIIPGAIGMRGNIFGALGSRLATNLHIGLLSPKFKRSKILSENILSSLILTMILSIFLAFLAKGICIIFGFESISLVDFTLISLFAGVISSVIMLPLTMLISLKSFENGWDPDNISTPVIAAFGDLFTLPAIILAVILVSFLSSVILKYSVFIFIILIAILSFIYGIKAGGEMKKILKQSTPVLLVCSFLGVTAGGFLNNSINTLLKNPSLLTLVPLFSGESGNLVSILGARLSSALHSGLISPVLKPEKITIRNFSIIIFLAIIIYPIIGLLAELSSKLLNIPGLGFIPIIGISTIAGILLISVMLLIVFLISSLSYKNGLDPDNIVIPISTSVTDSLSSLTLISISIMILSLLNL